ncbi:MAG: hypothetical protein P8179_07655 [Candidatus Thiodiazotropha sp.]|jgi:hypothetical protein
MEMDSIRNNFISNIDKIEIRDTHTNLINDAYEVYEALSGGAKISPDDEAIAVDWVCPGVDGSERESKLILFSRSGEVLDQANEKISSFEWLPDNRLVYVRNGEIYISSTPHRIDGIPVALLASATG